MSVLNKKKRLRKKASVVAPVETPDETDNDLLKSDKPNNPGKPSNPDKPNNPGKPSNPSNPGKSDTSAPPDARNVKLEIPSDFSNIVIDFTNDLILTFPELDKKFCKNIILIRTKDINTEDIEYKSALDEVFKYCCSLYPERFFDIIYKNEEIFTNEEIDCNFIPGIDFKYLWSCDISDKTRDTLWKYLQLVLFVIIAGINNGETFGDTAKLFEAINEDEFKGKLEETMNDLHEMFENISSKEEINLSDLDEPSDTKDPSDTNDHNNTKDPSDTKDPKDPKGPNISLDDLPNPDEMHDHINGMLKGKLGKLAQEIAEDTASNLNLDLDENSSLNDVFAKLFKNPTKLMDLVKNVGAKIDTKLKSGELKESELISEAGDMLNKMKDMPGMKNLQDMFGNIPGMGGMGGMPTKGGKAQFNNLQSQLNKQMSKAKTKERMQEKLKKKRDEREAAMAYLNEKKRVVEEANNASDDIIKTSVFKVDENIQRTLLSNKTNLDKNTINDSNSSTDLLTENFLEVSKDVNENENKKKKKKKKKKN